jgi:hypothetical protein
MTAEDLPNAPEAKVIALTPTPGYFTEPAIAVNPMQPQQVVAVFQDNAHAVDSRNSRLYVTWSDYRNADLDVFCAKSADQGKTWTPPVRVNNDSLHNGADQFFQWLAVDPQDGSVNILFYDRRGDPQNRKQVVALAGSTDGARSFTNYAWTDEPFETSCDVFFGDYTGIAALGGRVYGVWTEKPNRVPESDAKPEDKHPGMHGTVVKVGVADFKNTTARQSLVGMGPS